MLVSVSSTSGVGDFLRIPLNADGSFQIDTDPFVEHSEAPDGLYPTDALCRVAHPGQLASVGPDPGLCLLFRAAGCALPLPGVRIVEAVPVEGGTTRPPGTNVAPMLAAHFQVTGRMNERVGVGGKAFRTGFELRLPARWNGRFLYQGDGGNDGTLHPAPGRRPAGRARPRRHRRQGTLAPLLRAAGRTASPTASSRRWR